MLHEDLSGKILQACFEVSKELGNGFLESVYEKALLIALKQKGLDVAAQVQLSVKFRSVIIGDFYEDILAQNKILVELKAVNNLANEHFAQLLNYLKATEIEVCLIVNFGNPKIEYRRFDNRFLQKNNLKDFLN